jgi:hypothetical protein
METSKHFKIQLLHFNAVNAWLNALGYYSDVYSNFRIMPRYINLINFPHLNYYLLKAF